MKKILKKFLVIALILSITLSGALTAFGANSNGIKVQYNGENISFTDASAKIVDGRTMVPFRQILETMGATVTYDSKNKTIFAKTKDRDFSFVVGGKDITINANGKKEIKKMDVKPFIDKDVNRTYIPVRFIAESMGYSVGWDASEKTVVIINPEPLLANIDKDFSIIGKLFKSDLDLEKAYETKGQFSADVAMYNVQNTTPNMNFAISGDISGVQQKMDADLIMTFALNMDKMLSSMSAEEKAQLQPMLDMFKNTNMSIKMNGETGTTYMQSNLFSAVDPTIDKNTWYKMNIYDMYEDMGIDLRTMANLKGSYTGNYIELVKASLSQMECSDVSAYKDMNTFYNVLKNLIGNDAFKKTTSGGVDTYTLDINQASIIAALTKTALTEGASIDSLEMKDLEKTLKQSNLNANIKIQDKNGSLTGYSLKGTGSADGNNFELNMSGDQKNTMIDMTLDMKDVMKMIMKYDIHISDTAKTPNLTLPADAKVVDFPF